MTTPETLPESPAATSTPTPRNRPRRSSRRGGYRTRARSLPILASALTAGARAAVASGEIARAAQKAAYTFLPTRPAPHGLAFAEDVVALWLRVDGATGGPVARAGRFRSLPTGAIECVPYWDLDLAAYPDDRHRIEQLHQATWALLPHLCGLMEALFDQPASRFQAPPFLAAIPADSLVLEDNDAARRRMAAGAADSVDAAWLGAASDALVMAADGAIVPWAAEPGAVLPTDPLEMVVLTPAEFVRRRPTSPPATTHPSNDSPSPNCEPGPDGTRILTWANDQQAAWVAYDGRWVPACQPHRPVLALATSARAVHPALWALRVWPQVGRLIHPAINSPGLFREHCYGTWLDTVTALRQTGGTYLDSARVAVVRAASSLGVALTDDDLDLALYNPCAGFSVAEPCPAICTLADHGDESMRWSADGMTIDLAARTPRS